LQQKKEIEAKRKAAATENARQFNTLYQAKLAQDRAAEALRQKVDQHVIYELVKGDLVKWGNGAVTPFDDGTLANKKLFLIYFSAHWCNPCRLFTPGLVNYYNEMAAKHPEFDLIFVSRDKSPFGMETYMRETNMPWPAIDFQKVATKAGILKYEGEGIPDLVLVDASGKVLADSFQGKQYVGPAKVLQALDAILSKGPTEVAQAR
jgi:thiol-disulfide isomerase/thioredoxin